MAVVVKYIHAFVVQSLKSLNTYVSEENETTLGDLVASEEDIEALILEQMEREGL